MKVNKKTCGIARHSWRRIVYRRVRTFGIIKSFKIKTITMPIETLKKINLRKLFIYYRGIATIQMSNGVKSYTIHRYLSPIRTKHCFKLSHIYSRHGHGIVFCMRLKRGVSYNG